MIYLVCVGNLKEQYLSEACNEYLKRINRNAFFWVFALLVLMGGGFGGF